MTAFDPALDEEYMQVRVTAVPEGMRFFALQYGPNCEVLSPQRLRDIIKNDINEMCKKYF